MTQQIFISYSRVDSESTDKLIRRLKRTFPDFIIWHDSHLNSRGGQKWWDNILDGIEGSDIFLYLLSNESLASPYCQAEFAEAQRLERPFIAVQLRDRTEIPDSLADYQYINLANYKGEDDPYDDLVASINRLLSEGARAKRKKFPKKNRTPKPGTPEIIEAANRADVVTPPLVVPSTMQHQGGGVTAQYIIAVIGAIAVIFAAVITILPAILTRMDDARATQTASTLTQIAQVPTDTATISPTPTTDPVDVTLTAIFAEMAVAGVSTATTLAETQAYLANVQATTQAIETAVAMDTKVVERLATQITWTPIASNTPTPSPTIPTNTPIMTPTIPTNTPIPTPTIPTNTPSPTPEPLEEALYLASTPITNNAQWQVTYPNGFTQSINGIEMILIPSGEYEMGSTVKGIDEGFGMCQAATETQDECQRSWFDDEAIPSQGNTQNITSFWLDKTEVTHIQYEACVNTGMCEGLPISDYSNEANQPVNLITWSQAQAYCIWRGGRLPTEAEWEYAARGVDELIFPWGNNFIGDAANHCDSNCGAATWNWLYSIVNQENNDGFATTAPAGSYINGTSWVGGLDLSGNVWEWTSSLYSPYPYNEKDGRENRNTTGLRVVRGGSFNGPTHNLRAAVRHYADSVFGYEDIGFRCARSI
jgi:sulfatase modifying factor 1